LGELLIRAGLVTEKDVAAALERQRIQGSRIGENLVALGAIDADVLNGFLHRSLAGPKDIAATGIDEADLLALLMKLIYSYRLEKVGQFTDAFKLPQSIVMDLANMAIERQLLYTLGAHSSDTMMETRYALTDEGRRWTVDALQRSGYVGPAPVTLADFVERVKRQKPTNERISPEKIRTALGGLVIGESIIEQIGPALSSGRSMLLYGPPGNGKSSVAKSFASVFHDMIHVPYAIIVEGQIIRFFDPRVHVPLDPPANGRGSEDDSSFLRETHDTRWVPCRRPFVIAGGELTLEMLDMRYDSVGHYYEAPLHMKALGGCFFIDDFGRQQTSPRDLLNRWIVPMESRVDYLKMLTGNSFSIPFEETVIFATNLDPEDLIDPAFLRRIPYKIEVGPPNLEQYRRIFEMECERHNLTLSDEVFDFIMYMVREEKELDLAGFHATFIIDQVVATCRFLGKDPELRSPYIDYAIDNLRVKRSSRPETEPYHQPGNALKLARLRQTNESFD
jgi:energy-coupling factor transporter ATP-binding protein EcfA2